MKKNRLIKILKKHHKWPSLVLSLFIILFALSGIIMNHRSTFSSFDVNRNYLGKEYQYQNWNKAAVKSAVRLQGDTSLIYGNIGVWKTNDDFKTYSDFNRDFPKESTIVRLKNDSNSLRRCICSNSVWIVST